MTERPLPARKATIRDELRRVLQSGWTTARELSGLVGISEKEIPEHLEHLRRSSTNSGERFEVAPAQCAVCGFEFRDRARLSRPGKCPECRSERMHPPSFRIVRR